MGVEPQAVQLGPEPLTNHSKHSAKGSGRRAVADQHDCAVANCAPHHLQVACETQMRLIRITGHPRIHQSAPHDSRDLVIKGCCTLQCGMCTTAWVPSSNSPNLGEPKRPRMASRARNRNPAACPEITDTSASRGRASIH